MTWKLPCRWSRNTVVNNLYGNFLPVCSILVVKKGGSPHSINIHYTYYTISLIAFVIMHILQKHINWVKMYSKKIPNLIIKDHKTLIWTKMRGPFRPFWAPRIPQFVGLELLCPIFQSIILLTLGPFLFWSEVFYQFWWSLDVNTEKTSRFEINNPSA